MSDDATRETVLNAKTASIGGVALMALGAAVLAGGAYGVVTAGEGFASTLGLALTALAFGLGLLRGGQLLVVPKGGLDLLGTNDARRLAWRGVGDADRLTLPVTEVDSVRLVPRDEVWRNNTEIRNWSCEIIRRDGLAMVAAESTDYDAVWALGKALRHKSATRLDELADWEPTAARAGSGETNGRRVVQAGRRGRLAETIVGAGVVAAGMGAVLMSQVSAAPVFGFLFGPTLFFLGLAFLLAAGAGRFARDEIEWDTERVVRRSRLGPLSWGRKEIARSESPYLRIQHRGLQGASLELVGPRTTLVLVGGVSGPSALAPDSLVTLAAELASSWRGTDAP